MLRHPITLMASLMMLVGVSIYNYFHFTGGAGSEPSPGSEVAAAPAAGGEDLALLMERVADLRRTATAKTDPDSDLVNLTKRPFLHPEERKANRSLRAIEDELAATSSASPSATVTPVPLAAPTASLQEVLQLLAHVELTAVIWSEKSSVAVLGGEILHEGDEILGGRARIGCIEAAALRIQVGEAVITKRLKPYEAVAPQAEAGGEGGPGAPAGVTEEPASPPRPKSESPAANEGERGESRKGGGGT
ncbi:MAG: hypothetical protein AB1486_11975 [Planctomycetota bacterium]